MAHGCYLSPAGAGYGAFRHTLAQANGDHGRSVVDVRLPFLRHNCYWATDLHVLLHAVLVGTGSAIGTGSNNRYTQYW